MRTGTLWMGAAVLVVAAACNRNDARSADGSTDRDEQASVTLTGCVQSGEQDLAGPGQGPAAQSSENIDRFVLANAKTPGLASAESPGSTGPLYILEGKSDELRQHLSHEVEVKGRLDADTSPGDPQRLDVDSVRMIASTCSR